MRSSRGRRRRKRTGSTRLAGHGRCTRCAVIPCTPAQLPRPCDGLCARPRCTRACGRTISRCTPACGCAVLRTRVPCRSAAGHALVPRVWGARLDNVQALLAVRPPVLVCSYA
eukprot:452324-Rhodomonas_salina.1